MSSWESNNSQLTTFEKYERGRIIGEGGYGLVYAGKNVENNILVAIKKIPRYNVTRWEYIGGKKIPLEVCLLRKVSQVPGVIKIIDWFDFCNENHDSIYIITHRNEHSMDLYDFINRKGPLDEDTSRTFFHQIVKTVIACHETGVIHRDLKDDNIMVDTVNHQLTLIDFGGAAYLKNAIFYDFPGTEVYRPPEWISHKMYHGEQATVWSLGILLYVMLFGDVPFRTSDEILHAQIKFERKISKRGERLLKKCLSRIPANRPTLQDILDSSWLLIKT